MRGLNWPFPFVSCLTAVIVVALRHTMQLMDEIDAAIPEWPIA